MAKLRVCDIDTRFKVGDIVTHRWEKVPYQIVELTDYPADDCAVLMRLDRKSINVTSTLNNLILTNQVCHIGDTNNGANTTRA